MLVAVRERPKEDGGDLVQIDGYSRARSPRIAALPKKALSHFPLSSGHQSLRVRLRQTISVWLTNENPIGNLMGAVARIGITRIKRAIGTSNGRELF